MSWIRQLFGRKLRQASTAGDASAAVARAEISPGEIPVRAPSGKRVVVVGGLRGIVHTPEAALERLGYLVTWGGVPFQMVQSGELEGHLDRYDIERGVNIIKDAQPVLIVVADCPDFTDALNAVAEIKQIPVLVLALWTAPEMYLHYDILLHPFHFDAEEIPAFIDAVDGLDGVSG